MKRVLLILPQPLWDQVCNDEELLTEIGTDFMFLNAVPDTDTLDFETLIIMYLPETNADSMILKQWVDFACDIAGNPRAFIFLETVIWKEIITRKANSLPFHAEYDFALQRDITAKKLIEVLKLLKQKNA